MKLNRLVMLTTAAVLGLSSCAKEEPPPVGELILALQTDMQLPKDVDKVRIRIASFGNTLFSNDYQVGPNDLKIPATLGLLANPDHPSSPVTIQVIAFQGGKARVLRETITTIPQERIATLRIPIEWLCDDSAKLENGEPVSACPGGETCVSGACVPSAVDSAKLPNFVLADIFGGGDGTGNGSCFEVAQCFAKPVQVPVDPVTCRVTVPSMSPNLNVALKLPGAGDGICSGGVCLIPLDGGEGGQWSVAGGAGVIQLPTAACDRLAKGKVESVLVSTSCPTKTLHMPTCGPWSSTGGDAHITPDGGGMTTIDAGPSMGDGAVPRDGGNEGGSIDSGSIDSGASDGKPSAVDSGTADNGPTPIDSGNAPDVAVFVDSGMADNAMSPAESGMFDGGVDPDDGSVGPRTDASKDGGCLDDQCRPPFACAPPPPPEDGGFCTGVVSSPAPISACRWSVPGSIATMGGEFCPNLLNVHLVNWPETGAPPFVLPNVPTGECGETIGWQYTAGGTELELCPSSCSMSTVPAVSVAFMYGCPSMMPPPGGPPDGGGPPLDGGTQQIMRPILGGTFMMGCTPGDSSCSSDENPSHQVTVSDFSIDETEVTQGDWDACVRSTVCVAPPCAWNPGTSASKPVTCVSWDEANTYCSWVGKRLPSEAEWEIATRGTNEILFPWGNPAPDCTRANFSVCALGGPQPVRSFAAGTSFYGVHDMAGNVSEWVMDWYGSEYMTGGGPNPMGPVSGIQRVTRGGDYLSSALELRVSRRHPVDPVTRIDSIGFRCAKPGF